MRWIPIDTDRITFIGTSKTAEVAAYGELSDGTRQRIPGKQQTDDVTGLPMYVVDVMVMDPDAPRAEIIGVKVASNEPPATTMGQPVRFVGLRALGYVLNGGGNRVQYTFRADGIESPNTGRGHKPAENAA
ncbi:hypothetical protein [Pseudonocardia alni]|uniref:hypothetical protein n=1 Tax=Pseudonocardia alni TaxID=33907 RepID=UPI00280B7EA8|nr:hypothetical protein [Pseudonocardia alni]